MSSIRTRSFNKRQQQDTETRESAVPKKARTKQSRAKCCKSTTPSKWSKGERRESVLKSDIVWSMPWWDWDMKSMVYDYKRHVFWFRSKVTEKDPLIKLDPWALTDLEPEEVEQQHRGGMPQISNHGKGVVDQQFQSAPLDLDTKRDRLILARESSNRAIQLINPDTIEEETAIPIEQIELVLFVSFNPTDGCYLVLDDERQLFIINPDTGETTFKFVQSQFPDWFWDIRAMKTHHNFTVCLGYMEGEMHVFNWEEPDEKRRTVLKCPAAAADSRDALRGLSFDSKGRIYTCDDRYDHDARVLRMTPGKEGNDAWEVALNQVQIEFNRPRNLVFITKDQRDYILLYTMNPRYLCRLTFLSVNEILNSNWKQI